tara:strand:- start:420 stop:521 length:102 start_codon:yes stop_codon:yes gene_type:complete
MGYPYSELGSTDVAADCELRDVYGFVDLGMEEK